MFNKLKSALHEKIHGAKISRQNRQAKLNSVGADECETSSASSLEIDREDPDRFRISTTFAIELIIRTVVDLPASPAYFYVCVGEEGESTARKKKRGIHSSGVFYGKSPVLSECSFLVPINGLANPEVTLRFSRSSIVGSDTFLGESRFKVNLKGSLDSLGDNITTRVEGGGSAVVCLDWKLLPFDSRLPLEKRSNILPEVDYTSEIDKLNGLVDSVRKTLNSLVESKDGIDSFDSPMKYKLDFLLSIFNSISAHELDYVLLRISASDLVRFVPTLLESPHNSFFNHLMSGEISVMNLARIIRSLEAVPGSSLVMTRLILSCKDRSRLAELRYLLNRGGDKYDLVYLVKHAIELKNLRDQIMVHFDRNSTKSVSILSEIDQVVYSPFGSARMWPEGHIPGFKLLFDTLSEDVTFVSNRPISSLVDTRKIIREVGMGDAPLLMSPSPTPATNGGLIQRLQQSYSSCVIEAWKEYRQVFPRCSFIWFGENIEMAKELMSVEAQINGAKIGLAIAMGDDMVGRGGPVLVDHESGRIVACANYVQATMACLDYGYLTVTTIDRYNMLTKFQKLLDELSKELKDDKVRHKHLIKERISDMRFDLKRLIEKVHSLIRKAGLASNGTAAPSIPTEELVDSVILTPIEALSPTLTNHSPSPGPIGIATGSYDSEIILTGV